MCRDANLQAGARSRHSGHAGEPSGPRDVLASERSTALSILVLIPTHRRRTLLAQAIESVRRQSHTDWTCYVASVERIRTPHEPRLAVIPGRVGQPANRNALLDKWESTDAEFACWLDDDDTMAHDRLEKQLAHMRSHPDVDVLYTYLCYSVLSRDQVPMRHANWMVRTCDPTLYTDDPFSPGWHDNQNHATVMMRRSALAYRYPEEPMFGEDTVWLYSMYHGGLKFDVLPEVLYYYRIHAGNVSDLERRRSQPDCEGDLRRTREALERVRRENSSARVRAEAPAVRSRRNSNARSVMVRPRRAQRPTRPS